MLIYYLVALVPFALLGYVLWAYHRKAAEKEAASQERLALLMVASQSTPGLEEAEPGATPPEKIEPAPSPPSKTATPGIPDIKWDTKARPRRSHLGRY